MTHADLVERAARWLRGSCRCKPVFTEHRCWMTRESPDAFGINTRGTVVVECKVSVADFLADLRKPHRADPAKGMGRQRWYMVPAGVLPLGYIDRAAGWGLLEVKGQAVRLVRDSQVFAPNAQAEALLMRSAWLNAKDRDRQAPQINVHSVEATRDAGSAVWVARWGADYATGWSKESAVRKLCAKLCMPLANQEVES